MAELRDDGLEQMDVEDALEGEVVISESTSKNARTIRVYDKGRGDFTLEIPAKARVTFSYFNPAASGDRTPNDMYGGRGGNTMKQTALRIYEGGEKTPQLAAFLAVDGFRDLSLKLTRLRQRVVIESNFEDDGEGMQQWGGKEQRLLSRADEDEVF